MSANTYDAAWGQLVRRRRELRDSRADLETQLSEVNNELAHLDEAVSHLALLAGRPVEEGSVQGLGITDAIRSVLRQADGNRLSPSDIYQVMHNKWFDFSGYSQPMASIYKILARLKEGDEVEVEKEDHKIFYKWKNTDEDFPF